LAVHAALRHDLAFGDAGIASAAAGYGTSDGMARHLERHNLGELETEDPWLLVVNQTVVDPSRAPEAATFKILTLAPYELADGRNWADVKDAYGERLVSLVAARASGLEPNDILMMRTESPVDVAGHNPHNIGGSCHGGEFLVDGRVVPGWMRYDTDVPRLFVTGATTHPGGSVSGRPGRNAARSVLRALDMDPTTVMGRS
jgi:phytoene dehydrogenase-like protein